MSLKSKIVDRLFSGIFVALLLAVVVLIVVPTTIFVISIAEMITNGENLFFILTELYFWKYLGSIMIGLLVVGFIGGIIFDTLK